eukprot:scaffold6978_cov64-Phaeocystis_antarctica.AAC.14
MASTPRESSAPSPAHRSRAACISMNLRPQQKPPTTWSLQPPARRSPYCRYRAVRSRAATCARAEAKARPALPVDPAVS